MFPISEMVVAAILAIPILQGVILETGSGKCTY
jgi:hypothetical protein